MQILIYNDTFQINCQPYADFVSPLSGMFLNFQGIKYCKFVVTGYGYVIINVSLL